MLLSIRDWTLPPLAVPTEEASKKRAAYASSVFVKVGSATFCFGKTAQPPSACFERLSFNAQYLRLLLREPDGTVANPGRQVSVTRIEVQGRPIGQEPLPSLKTARAEVDRALAELGVDPTLASGYGASAARQQGDHAAGGSNRTLARHPDGALQQGDEAEDCDLPEIATDAAKRVASALHIARTKERFCEAERLSLAAKRVRNFGLALSLARRAQRQACFREDFDEAKICRDEAREAEAWLQQEARDAEDVMHRIQGAQARQLEVTASSMPQEHAVSTPDYASECRDTIVLKPGSSRGSTRLRHDSSAEETLGTLSSSSLSHDLSMPESTIGSAAARLDQVHSDGDVPACSHGREVGEPPWKWPASSSAAEPWKALLREPWPTLLRSEFDTVFCHRWSGACSDSWGIDDTRRDAAYQAATSATVQTKSPPELSPGDLFGTTIRLVAASQDLRSPGPVPPDVRPFRHATSADARAPLCSFSDEAENGHSGGVHGSRRRAFACPAADRTPCATQVTNWIEDHPRLAWGARSRGLSGRSTLEGSTAAASGCPSDVRNGAARSADWPPSAKHAAAAESRTRIHDLPDIVGAGGFASTIPLLSAVIGRCPISAACDGFPAEMREAATMECCNHLPLAADVATRACIAAAAADCFQAAVPRPARTGQREESRAFTPPNAVRTTSGTELSPAESEHRLRLAVRGAVTRAGCLAAANGLMDSSVGSRRKATSLAMTALSLWSSPPPTGGGGAGDSTTPAFLESPAMAAWDASGSSGAESNQDVRLSRALTVPLMDLRWALGLVLACIAPCFAAAEDTADSEQRSSDEGTKVHVASRHSAPEERRSDTTVAYLAAADGTPVPNNSGATEATTGQTPTPIQSTWGEDEAHHGRSEARKLLDFAARSPHIGPALVASILVGWIPHLVRYARPDAKSARGIGGQARAVLVPSSANFAAGEALPRSTAVPAAMIPEDASAAETLAAGAINMLAFMVRRFPLLELSCFSAAELTRAAEGGMAFGGGDHPGAEPRTGLAKGTRRKRWKTSGCANRAAEALMRELFLVPGSGGIDDLLPGLSSARGIACAHEISTFLSARPREEASSGKGPSSHDGVAFGEACCGVDLAWPLLPEWRESLVAKVDIRKRLEMSPSARRLAPKSPSKVPPPPSNASADAFTRAARPSSVPDSSSVRRDSSTREEMGGASVVASNASQESLFSLGTESVGDDEEDGLLSISSTDIESVGAATTATGAEEADRASGADEGIATVTDASGVQRPFQELDFAARRSSKVFPSENMGVEKRKRHANDSAVPASDLSGVRGKDATSAVEGKGVQARGNWMSRLFRRGKQ